MDLTKQHPRSPNELMAGLVSLARTTDKARAFNAGTLGDYDYDCPHDKPLLEFLGVDGAAFAKQAQAMNDAELERWVRDDLLAGKSKDEIEAFNESRRSWRPEPGSHSAEYFDELRRRVAPNRPEVSTWFDLLDLDEGRSVAHAHA